MVDLSQGAARLLAKLDRNGGRRTYLGKSEAAFGRELWEAGCVQYQAGGSSLDGDHRNRRASICALECRPDVIAARYPLAGLRLWLPQIQRHLDRLAEGSDAHRRVRAHHVAIQEAIRLKETEHA